MKDIYTITPDFFIKRIEREAEEIRSQKASYFSNFDFRHDKNANGANGVRFEYECHSSRDKQTKIGKEKNNDVTVYIDLHNGTCRREKAECKTNGGRIDSILEAVENGKNFIVIYELYLQNSTTQGKLVYIEPRYTSAVNFIEILKKCNAIKIINKKGQFDGYAIQPSNRKFWSELEKLPRFYRNQFLEY